ncbi:hypothetical protein BXZ70DRAFT_1064312 [Cristinia sonorae]|uniref:Meiotically up-regulated gene 152 protein n=1 Tax=Cristinia sonorae TaxID=1940300 RepID=A0A8K0UQG5_9AGAR|nr:hypothetical protein BXZ70DRAFT_1064312 [Cristinia sonorae]
MAAATSPTITPPEMPTRVPSSSTFSFTAPYPPNTPASSNIVPPLGHKQQRRVSLALPSSPRVFPAWSFRDDTGLGNVTAALLPEKRGKMRKISTEDDDMAQDQPSTSASQPQIEKKQRKKWTMEETQMLVNGCNKWGVGNWKAILNDPEFVFDNRSPVDLKDRFRTYYPDAYKEHYPNAKTHLSSKVRSALPDGSSIFEKTRSKKRRPFTEEEDRALKAGYDKHGTVWATIVKDPVFQEQNRRSTDLRDRFRNAFPELYQAAGYKPRLSAKKKKELGLDGPAEPSASTMIIESPRKIKARGQPVRAATDDQLSMGRDGLGPVRRKRRHTTQGLFRGGTKSVPESTTNSEDEDSSDEEDKDTPPSSAADITSPNSVQPPTEELSNDADCEVGMDIQPLDNLADQLPDFMSSDMTDSSQATTWSSIDAPLHSWTSSASSASNGLAASPSPTHEYLLPHSPIVTGANTMIGKSAWGPQDWLSANPRLDANGSNSSYLGGSTAFSPQTPSSPNTFSSSNNNHLLSLSHASLNHLQSQQGFHHPSQFSQSHSHGVFDRLDLWPNSLSHDYDLDIDFISEGFGGETTDEQSAFSDPSAWTNTTSGMRGGFTHHSNYAGDLIFGARTHQPSGHMHMDYGHGFGFGSSSGAGGMDIGLGLEGVQRNGSKPKSGLHTPALPGIDEIELTNITLDDREYDIEQDLLTNHESIGSNDISMSKDCIRPLALEEIVGLPSSDDESALRDSQDSGMNVAMTPPHTPYTGIRSSGRTSVPGSHASYGPHVHHSRSVSVPPSEHRNPDPHAEMAHSQTPNPQRKYKPLPTTSGRQTFQPFQLPSSMPPPTITPSQAQSVPRPSQASHPPSSFTAPSVPYKVPYLDLHYYTNLAPGMALLTTYPKSHLEGHAQALDLAQSLAQVAQAQAQAQSPSKPLCISPSSLMQFNSPAPTTATATATTPSPFAVNTSSSSAATAPVTVDSSSGGPSSSRHQRGLSAISPQDLLVRRGSDTHKRKRASWDGGAS